MPCEDITDVLQLRIDDTGQLSKYWLRKRSCGGAVGERSLIFDWAQKHTSEEIIAMNVSDFLRECEPPTDEVFEYLLIKHFFAVQSGLAILLGKGTGTPKDFCTIDYIEHSPQGIDLVAYLRMDVITEQIKACGRCGTSCGTKKPDPS